MINAIRTFRYKLVFLWLGWFIVFVPFAVLELIAWPLEELALKAKAAIEAEVDKGFD